jgi:hypothetical protein
MDGRIVQSAGGDPALPVLETMSMQGTGSVVLPRRGLGRARWLGAGLAVTVVALGAGLAVTALPAYADVTSSDYTIGTPTGAVTSIAATPVAATTGASTQFTVTFITPAALSGNSDSWVTVTPSESLGSVPVNIALVGGSCIQSGTTGSGGAGIDSAATVTIELNSTCAIAAGTSMEVIYTADAPTATSTFNFTITTSGDTYPTTSNEISVSSSGSSLTASSLSFGANATYTINSVTVANLTSIGTTLTLIANATAGAETIAFYNGAAGYSVTYTPSGGSATADTVTAAAAAGASVTLTLGTALANGDAVTITAEGTNPAYNSATEADDITVQPGNGTPLTTTSVTFGNSVSSVSVVPSNPIAGASTNYTAGFRAADAVSAGGDIYLSELAGPTNFSLVTGVDVSDQTLGWNFVATGSLLTSGTAVIPLQEAINAGDAVTVLLSGVINPPAGTVSDFQVKTTGDPNYATAPSYTISTNASPGVVVAVSPSTTGSLATYTISNVEATAALAGGSSSLELEAPSGTTFSNVAGYFSIVDTTNSAGSGTVTALSGGSTNTVTLTVPHNISAGDVLTITAQDVINPSVASSTEVITIVGSVTGPGAIPTTTTTTTTVPPTTTTTVPKPVPVVVVTTKSATVGKGNRPGIALQCKVSNCKGYITLSDVVTKVGSTEYSFKAGKSHTYPVQLNANGIKLLKGAKAHTIKVNTKVSVTGGKTITVKVTLVG